jgi:uncharacterized protein (TIGR03435 family)
MSIHAIKAGSESNNWSAGTNGDAYRATGITLSDLVGQAYSFSIGPLSEQEISGTPRWFRTERFVIEAKVDPADVEAYKKATDLSMADEVAAVTSRTPTTEMLMLRQVLESGFHLSVHHEIRNLPVYALVVAKKGSKLQKAEAGEHGELNMNPGVIKGTNVPLLFLKDLLAPELGRPVVDQTNLKGLYDVKLTWTPAADQGKEDAGPSLFTAIQEQLGLKLEPTKAPIDILVIDHVEEPSAN